MHIKINTVKDNFLTKMNNGATLGLPLGIRYSINRIINKKRETVDKRVAGGRENSPALER